MTVLSDYLPCPTHSPTNSASRILLLDNGSVLYLLRNGLPRVLASAVLRVACGKFGCCPITPQPQQLSLSCGNIATHHLIKPNKPLNKARMRVCPLLDLSSIAPDSYAVAISALPLSVSHRRSQPLTSHATRQRCGRSMRIKLDTTSLVMLPMMRVFEAYGGPALTARTVIARKAGMPA